MLLELFKELGAQADQLRRTPSWSLFGVLIIGATISWQAVKWEYEREIETLREQRQTALDKADLKEQQLKAREEREEQEKGARQAIVAVPNQFASPSSSSVKTTSADAQGQETQKAFDPLEVFSELRTSNLRVDDIAVQFKRGTKPSTHTTVAAAVHGRIVKTASDMNTVLIRIDSAEDWERTVDTLMNLPDVANAVWGPELYPPSVPLRVTTHLNLGTSYLDKQTSSALSNGDVNNLTVKNAPKVVTPDEKRNAIFRSVAFVGLPTFVFALGLYFVFLRIRRRTRTHDSAN